MDINKIINQKSQEDLILFLETVALLHDIGKLSTNFIHSKALNDHQEDTHALLPLSDIFPEIFKKSITISSNCNKQKPFEFNPFTLICSHHGCERCPKDCLNKHKNPLITLLRLADQKASEEEKGFLLDISRQPKDETYFSSPLGKELLVFIDIMDECRAGLWKIINKAFEEENILKIRDQIFQDVKTIFTFFPSETRRPGNDLSLWDHSFVTATYFKIALYEMFLNGKNLLSTQKIPVVFLKIKNGKDTVREFIETRYCSGNLVLSLGGYHIYAVAESFLQKNPFPDNDVSESFYSLIPNLKDEIDNLKSANVSSVILPDYRSLFQLYAESSFTHPLTQNMCKDAEAILNKVMTQNYLREKKEIEERIESISRHIINLEKSGLKDEKKSEYLSKIEDINRLKTNLSLLTRISETFNISEDLFLRPNLPIWEISIINLYQNWSKAYSTLTFNEYSLYSLFQRKPSVSSCSSLLREVSKLLKELEEFLLNKDYHCFESEGILYIKEPLTKDVLLECKKLIYEFSGNNIGLLPIYWHNISKILAVSPKQKNHFHKAIDWKWGFSSRRFLIFKFKDKESAMIPLDRTDNDFDYYRFYRKKSNERFVHLSEVKTGDTILWFFPLDKS